MVSSESKAACHAIQLELNKFYFGRWRVGCVPGCDGYLSDLCPSARIRGVGNSGIDYQGDYNERKERRKFKECGAA